ncbi:MAG: hypothetical protein A2Y23_09775 [Clostridiales bacterium GWB2_37_7]|nr:MAG: hypothetical protein A2Y23_09775 [Clostridiales bacterium GWB2_37_7]
MNKSAENLNSFCYELENSYYKDNDITSIFQHGVTPQNILNTSRIIRDKEKSRFLKLPVDFISPIKAQTKVSIKELPKIAEAIYCSEDLKAALESIELADNEDIILRVLGPFSALLENVDTNTLFKWLCKHKSEMHFALEKTTETLAAYINSALNKGVNIISFAEPSALAEVIGEDRYKEFIIYYTVKLLKEIEANLDKSIVHICPRTSFQLERYGFVTREVISYCSDSYGKALLELAQNNNIKYIGHRCINAENTKVDKIYVLKLL